MQFRRFLSSLVVCAFVSVLSLSFPLAGQTNQASLHSDVKVSLPDIRIGNFGRIDANYFRGAQPQGRDYNDLAALGVKTVINLTGDDGKSGEQQMVEGAGMKYVHIPMTTHVAPAADQIQQFLSLVEDRNSGPVFVHCVGGKHRTGVMTAVYRMTEDGWSADQAFKEMKQYKFGMEFLHPEFKKFVYAYHPDHAHVAVSGGSSSAPTSDVNASVAGGAGRP